MSRDLSTIGDEPGKATKANSPERKMREELDDGAYPSSESDAEVDIPEVMREGQPLLSSDSTILSQHQDKHNLQTMHPSARQGLPTSGSTLSRARRTPLKRTEYIWIIFTLTLISILGFSSQLCIMLPYYHITPSFSPLSLAAVLVPFNLGLLAIFYNYYLCIFTDPGSVPVGWEPDWSALHAGGVGAIELKETILKPRYCKTCSAYKPPRSHHCKTCQRCILRMDHHCPWLANCVGHFNYAHFIRFLFWVDVTCAYHLVMVSARVLDKFNSYGYWREPSTKELVWLVVNYALCIPVLLLVGCFSGYHFYCVAVNQTTIEGWEKDRVATMVRRGRIRKVKYPYDLGVSRNVKSVLGDNFLFWCLPGAGRGRSRRGDREGVWYETTQGIGKFNRSRRKRLYRWLFRSVKSRRWRESIALQDDTTTAEVDQEIVLDEDDECYINPELEATVLHRLRYEDWHIQQKRWEEWQRWRQQQQFQEQEGAILRHQAQQYRSP